jgi:competence protein ComEC
MSSYPIMKVAIFFSGGILFYKIADMSSSVVIIFIVSLLIFSLFLFKISKTVTSVFILLAVFFSGYLIERNSEKDTYFFPQEVYRVKELTVYGRITDIKLIKQKDLTFNFETDSLKTEARVLRKNVKLLCKLRETSKKRLDSVYNILEPGNYLQIMGAYYKGREMRNPGEFDYNKYLNSLGISGTLNITGAKNISLLGDESDFFKSAIFSIRKFLDSEIKSLHNEQTSSLLKGLLLADRSEIDYVTKTQFINAGVIHVLAVSGLHVGFIVVIFLFLFGRLNIYMRSVLTITGLLLFMLITGMPPSVFRATLMAVIIIIAFLFNRSTNLLNSLALAALIILLINPDELFNPGFQLSFSAVIGIALLYSPLEALINKLKLKSKVLRCIILFMVVSLSAQVGTLPFTLTYFGKLSVIALIANLIVIPITAIIVGLGIFTLIINSFLPFIGVYFAAANNLVTKILFLIVKISGSADFSYISVRNFSLYDSLLFYLFLFFLLYSLKNINRNTIKFAILTLVVVNFLFLSSLDNSDLLKDKKLSMCAIDIGQGDAILIKFPEGTIALIDAGNVTPYFDNGERVILPLLEYLGIDKIDYGFVSHIDSDHYAGFVSLVNAGVIKKIFKPQIDSTLVKDVKFEKYLRVKSIPVEYYKKEILKIDGTKIYVLNNETISKNRELSTNNKSGVLKIVYGRTSFLFTGDIERKVEKIYASYYKSFLNVNVLKVAHHGSNTSSSPAFLNYVTPEKSVINVGILNKFKHPSEKVVKRLEDFGSEIYRTDKYGALIFESDGESIGFIDWKRQD